MNLTIRNNHSEEIQHRCEEFDGYEIFCLARDTWDNWHTYEVLDGDKVIERVINPLDLDPKSAQRIH
jgi:hypothetical protein